MNRFRVLAAILTLMMGIIWGEQAFAACFKRVPINTIWSQTICPNSANEREVSKSGTFYITISVPCASGSGGGSWNLGGAWGHLQEGDGGGPGMVTPIEEDECRSPGCTGKVCETNSDCSGSSVLLSNGTYEFTETDLKISARTIQMDWKRTYRSNRVLHSSTGLVFGEPQDGPLGFGWTNEFLSKIVNGDTYIDGEGRYYTFKKDAAGNFLSDAESSFSLKKTTTGFEVSERGGLIRAFDANGKLLEIRSQNGKKVSLSYGIDGNLSSITDASNRQVLTFSYDSNNRITTVSDMAGRAITYAYDAFGNLITSTDPASNIRNYTYNSYHGITTKANELGETYTIEYRYPDKGITGRVIDPIGTALLLQGQPVTGHESVYLYDLANKTFYITDKNGRQIVRTVNDQGKLTFETEASSNAILRKIEYVDARTEIHTDQAGNKKTIQKDEWGNIIRSIDGEGNETITTYNAQNKPLTITDPMDVITKFEYDTTGTKLIREVRAHGRPEETITEFTYTVFGELERMSVGGAVTAYVYNDFGNRSSMTNPLGNVTTFEYDQYGNATAIVDASGNRTEFTYDILGNLIETKDPLGNSTIHTYNAVGRRVSTRDALNRTTQYETDFKGRVTAVIDALGNRKEYEYDGNGNLLKITQGPAVTTFAYDSNNRLTSVTDAEGNTTAYEYKTASASCSSCGGGNASSPFKVTDPLGNTTEYIFDNNGMVNAIKDPLTHITSLAYDAGGRITSRLDANGNLTRYEHNALGRVLRQIDANNGVISFQYDTRGNLISMTDQSGHTTTFEYDLADRKTKEANPLGQSTEYTYYPNGLLYTLKDAKNQIFTFAYDPVGRPTSITYADGKQDIFTYNAIGNMLTYANENVNGAITYDALNRKLTETVNYGTFSKTYSYTYDSRGNKSSYTNPEGVVYSYSYNLVNLPIGIIFGSNSISYEYLANRLIKATFTNGITTDYQYNANSRLTYITTKQGATTLLNYFYDFDNVGNITNKNTEHGTYNYNYDTIYHLTSAESPSLQEAFTYDPAGNRTVDTSAPVGLTFGTTGFYYNSRNRLESVTLPDSRTVTYSYDPFGRRIKKDVAGQVTFYAYSDEGLIGEYDSIGILTKAYGWKPNSTWGTDPILTTENGEYYYYNNDHLGTPQRLIDSNGNTVWSATYTAFGDTEIHSSFITNNIRFPGQYFDTETGLNYNWNRYYDPVTGRYTQGDPIGLGGDENLYRYVNSNPLNLIDFLGLAWTTANFVSHYYVGHGNPVNLSDIGLLPIFRSARSVFWATTNFKLMLWDQAYMVAKSLCGNCDVGIKTRKYMYNNTTTTDVTFEPNLFAVGDSTFFKDADCGVVANCESKTFTYSCKMHFYIRDWFKDPLDIGLEPGGEKYRINADWNESASGSGGW